MPLNSENIEFLVGRDAFLQIDRIPSLPIFSETVVDFLDAMSKELFKDQRARAYPEVITFAFWCRKANIISLKAPYADACGRMGKGLTFHIAPSNVPVNFAYSLCSGMLSGNANIVRVPSKEFEQVDIICCAIRGVLSGGGFETMAKMICLIRYDRSSSATRDISSVCRTRIIWGGDDTIAEVRRSPLPPRSTEIPFSDRYSLCVINADEYLKGDHKKTAQAFFNDTYLTDQNACTSPRIVIWLGENTDRAKDIFWSAVSDIVGEKYSISPVQSVNKLTALFRIAAGRNVRLRVINDFRIVCVEVDELDGSLMDYRENSGYFFEYSAKQLSDIYPLCGLKCQTVSYIGLDREEILDFIRNNPGLGVDRVVPVGKTLDFALVWDGFDLIYGLSRSVNIE